jgi:hypothetical protein
VDQRREARVLTIAMLLARVRLHIDDLIVLIDNLFAE